MEDLRKICRENGLTPKGKKHNLVYQIYNYFYTKDERKRITEVYRAEMEKALKQLSQLQQKNVIEMHKQYIQIYNYFRCLVESDKVDLPLHFIRSWENYVPITGEFDGEISNQDSLSIPEIEIGPYRIKSYAQNTYLDECNDSLLLSACGCTWEVAWHSHAKYTISFDNKNKLLSANDDSRVFA